MRFEKDTYAQVTIKSEIEYKENGEVKSSTSHYFADSQSVYDFLIDYFDSDTAADAESWTELASVGEFYENDSFEIEMMEKNQMNKPTVTGAYETLAHQFCEAIKTFSEKPENLENFEGYLGYHFPVWMKKYANTPENLVAEMNDFANMEIAVDICG